MKRFVFRFQSLLRLRESERDLRRMDLGEALALEAKLTAQKTVLEGRRDAEQAALREVVAQPVVDVDRTLELRRYQSLLRAEIQISAAQIEVLGKEIERRRSILIEADRAVEVFEKLRQKHAQHHQKQLDREEVRTLDEIAARLSPGDPQACASH